MILKQTGKAFSNFVLEPSKNRLPAKFRQYLEIRKNCVKKKRHAKTEPPINPILNQTNPHMEGPILIQFQVT